MVIIMFTFFRMNEVLQLCTRPQSQGGGRGGWWLYKVQDFDKWVHTQTHVCG